MSDKKICHICKEETVADTTSKKWNILTENEKPRCFECDMKIFKQENYHLYQECGPEETEQFLNKYIMLKTDFSQQNMIAEENERIKRNNEEYHEEERSENNYI